MVFKRRQFSSIRKCKKCLREARTRHKKLTKKLHDDDLQIFDSLLENLSQAIAKKDKANAEVLALELTHFLDVKAKKSFWDHTKEFFFAIIIALAIAGVVRQTWFELYEIPTGSMRPTFREGDDVLVVKNAFGINTPFQTSHLYFDPESVKRGNIVVVTGDGLDLSDVDTMYFGIFPGKRRYVKRLVAKGGDQIYFYGGKIYGVSKSGDPIVDIYDIEHIPFITFEGSIDFDAAKSKTIYLKHMNTPLAKITPTGFGTFQGEIPTAQGWEKERFLPNSQSPEHFSQFWGIGNYAMMRFLMPKELPQDAIDKGYQNSAAVGYLELRHSPTLAKRSMVIKDPAENLLQTKKSWLPLTDAHIDRLKKSLYTARFYIRNGTTYHYGPEGFNPRNRGFYLDRSIPDGLYEFYDGIAYEIGLGSIAHKLDPSHPIYPKTILQVQKLYNYGIDLHHFPARYGYFRDGSFFTMGYLLMDAQDAELQRFESRELQRSESNRDYLPFIDRKAPLKDGTIDAEFIKAFGYRVPDGHYLLLGDNHAMSNDSRFFGAVPEKNLEGSPILLFWPPGPRWGAPLQPEIPFFRLSNMIILLIVGVSGAVSYYIISHRQGRKYEKKI